ncbi:unnamed protein product [Durusdinium trenchii]|uniref:RNA helicase n=1 Tax=Durusdinium trenchii TaxID=1381693 RepID=A0ABP0L1Y5_9DINO
MHCNVTEQNVSLYVTSPFIVHEVIHQRCLLRLGDEHAASYNRAIQAELLQSKVINGASRIMNMKDEQIRDEPVDRMRSAIKSSQYDLIVHPVASFSDAGAEYQAQWDALHLNQGQYMVKVITGSKALRPHLLTKAIFCRYVLSRMLGQDGSSKLGNSVVIVLGDGTEISFDHSEQVIKTQCDGLVQLMKSGQVPKPTAQDLRLHPTFAEVAFRHLLKEHSLELIPLKPGQKRALCKRGIDSLTSLRRATFDQVKDFMSEQVFLKVRRHAKLLADETKDFCMASVDQPLLLAPAAFIVVDLVEGTEPLLNSFVVRSSECGVFHTGQMQEFVQKIASHQVYFFGAEVWDKVLLSCLALGRADLAGRVLQEVYEGKWVDLKVRLDDIVCNKTGDSFEDYYVALLGKDSCGDLRSFQTLPQLLEVSRSSVLPQRQRREAEERFRTLVSGKTHALQQLGQWIQRNVPSQYMVKRSAFVQDLLVLCTRFLGMARNPGWPEEVWNVAKKWPDFYKQELFWRLVDTIELFNASEDEWTEHVLCLSRLKRAQLNPRTATERMNGRFLTRSLRLEYDWNVTQETTIKEKDEVFVREDATLRGKVEKIDNSGAGRLSKVTLLFDTSFGKNPNLDNLLGPSLERISIMQAQFAMVGGENIMTKAVEQRLASIIATPWMMLKQSFRNFLQRKPVSQTPVEECRAKDTVCNLTEDYLIIQGPPGTGKTYTSAKIIQRLLQQLPSRVIVSSNSHRAIRNLLSTISSFNVPVAKVLGNDETHAELRAEGIDAVENARGICFPSHCRVLGGTASQLMKLAGDSDYLFVDEAGQVTLELLAVLGQLARNLVLVGDQQQLPPPVGPKLLLTKGGGVSCLDYFSQGDAVINSSCGIFLPTTYRMSDRLTQVISSNFYDKGLSAFHRNAGNRLILSPGLLQVDTGAEFISVPHEGNLQSSEMLGSGGKGSNPESEQVFVRVGRCIGKVLNKDIGWSTVDPSFGPSELESAEDAGRG